MALIACPECKRNVSDKAKACPGCGYQIRDRSAVLAETSASVASSGAGEGIRSETASSDTGGCLSGIGCLVIIALVIISAFGFHYILIGGVPIAIGTVCIGIYQLMKRVDPDL